KEDGVTRIGNNNLLMSNSHVAHNCRIYNSVLLVNGVLLGGHVHVHDKAIISGNSVVHHFATVGTLAFVSGGCRVPTDIPPYMLSAGSDNPEIKTVNVIGMKRAGIPNSTILLVREAQKLVFRDHLPLAALKAHFEEKLDGVIPLELAHVFRSLEEQRQGKMGRAREAARDTPYTESKKVA
ncbi:MAG: acyl-ACP--UDP-N-acetylglucosamine O-acyltransferase, partial [Planctomycetaceae bacterium]|nr:acyl-ACP--UDP-N-acetylglucosamine O-acyltransferase [Planctomycetaceae bacterium]